jgi:hypothetical protein
MAITLLAALGFAPKRALAQPASGLTIHWDAPPRCPQQSEVRERVRKLSGSLTSLQGDLQADGTITKADDGRYHLKLVMRSGQLVGEHNIDSTSCTDLTRAAAVAIALLLRSGEPPRADDLGGSRAPDATGDTGENGGTKPDRTEDHPAPEDKPPATQTPTKPEPPAREPEPKTRRSWNIRLRAPLAALSIGPLPKPSWGLAFAAGVSNDSWRWWLEGKKWWEQAVPANDFPGYSANVQRVTASLTGCRAQRFSIIEVAPCLVLSLERLTAAGAGQNVAPDSQHVTWFGAGVGAQGRVYITSWFSLGLSVEGEIEASRPRLYIGGVGTVTQISPAQFSVNVGPEWIL